MIQDACSSRLFKRIYNLWARVFKWFFMSFINLPFNRVIRRMTGIFK